VESTDEAHDTRVPGVRAQLGQRCTRFDRLDEECSERVIDGEDRRNMSCCPPRPESARLGRYPVSLGADLEYCLTAIPVRAADDDRHASSLDERLVFDRPAFGELNQDERKRVEP
jgi:hypothetical protein